jgi:hypothetical protein
MKTIIIIVICMGLIGSACADETDEPRTSMDELRTLVQPEKPKSDNLNPIPMVDVIGPHGSETLIEIPKPPEGQVVWQ